MALMELSQTLITTKAGLVLSFVILKRLGGEKNNW